MRGLASLSAQLYVRAVAMTEAQGGVVFPKVT